MWMKESRGERGGEDRKTKREDRERDNKRKIGGGERDIEGGTDKKDNKRKIGGGAEREAKFP